MEAAKGRKRHYCTICSNYRGKEVQGRIVKLHRFPSEPRLLRIWQKRLRLVRKDFKYNEHIRLCSEHFLNRQFTRENPVPCIFANRTFQTASLDDEDPAAPAAHSSTSSNHTPYDSEGDESEQEKLPEASNLDASVMMHDYVGVIRGDSISKFVNKCQQTDVNPCIDCGIQASTSTICFDVATQTDFVQVEQRNEQLKGNSAITNFTSVGTQVKRPDLAFEDIKYSDEKVMFYTGLPNAGVFHTLFNEMGDAFENTHRNKKQNEEQGGRPRILDVSEEFFLVLLRLRLGLLLQDLADRFFISKSTCGIIVDKWTDYLHVKLAFLTTWPTKQIINETMPNKFKQKYPDCRVIVDCTELFTETPQSLANKSIMYSHYKSQMTYKALVGISPSGMITFASDLWGGSISDKQLTKNCGILDLCEAGDSIMADKGFLISDLTTPRGIKLILPPFKTKRFSRREVEETRRIASLRIDVERAMERIKNFRILQGVMPITLSKKASKIWKICVNLSNLQPPLVNDASE